MGPLQLRIQALVTVWIQKSKKLQRYDCRIKQFRLDFPFASRALNRSNEGMCVLKRESRQEADVHARTLNWLLGVKPACVSVTIRFDQSPSLEKER